jgi:hypothetical protein
MDEAGWRTCTEPWQMLHVVRRRATDRQRRLFAAGCCRLVWDKLPFERCRQAVELGERYADDLAGREELEAALRALNQEAAVERGPRARLAQASACLLRPRFRASARRVLDWALDILRLARTGRDQHLLPARQCDLLRDILGNPFRRLPPRGFPAHVVGLAQAIYSAFPVVSPDYAILANGLEELGEDQAVAHCREAAHWKGCHVVDWILERE